MTPINRRAVRWLRAQLPELVASGVISSDSAQAIDRHYAASDTRSNFGFVLMAIVGTVLVSAGIILLIAHNWDELSRTARTIVAFLPLLIAQALAVFVLWRRNESKPWRESVAILDVAAVATAISLISQTYQIQGTFANFMCVWLLLSIPIVYIFRTTLGACAYIIGTVVWLFAKTEEAWRFGHTPAQLFFWPLLLLVLPYGVVLYRRNRESREVAIVSTLFTLAAAIGVCFVAEAARSNLGGVALAGLFAGAYLCGMTLFSRADERLPPLAWLGGIAVASTAVVLSFEEMWRMTDEIEHALPGPARAIAIAIELFFPVTALLLLVADYFQRRKITLSVGLATAPLAAGLAWLIANLAPAAKRADGGQQTPYSFTAALVLNVFALLLGIELLARGIRAGSIARANFGLLIIAALAIARFFDSDLSFLTRGLGFIGVGVGFLVCNFILFKRGARA